MKVDLHSILIQPLLTEKITALREAEQYGRVSGSSDANRVRSSRLLKRFSRSKWTASMY